MKVRIFRWFLLTTALVLLVKNVFGDATTWSISIFLACGGAWYWLGWRKSRELDAPRPR